MKLAVPGGVGIFLCQGIIAMSSIRWGDGERAGGNAHTSAERGKVYQGANGEYFAPGSSPGPQHCPSEGIQYHSQQIGKHLSSPKSTTLRGLKPLTQPRRVNLLRTIIPVSPGVCSSTRVCSYPGPSPFFQSQPMHSPSPELCPAPAAR